MSPKSPKFLKALVKSRVPKVPRNYKKSKNPQGPRKYSYLYNELATKSVWMSVCQLAPQKV